MVKQTFQLISKDALFKPVDARILGAFRIVFGLLMVWQSFIIFDTHFIYENFIKPYYHFPYTLFDTLHMKRLAPDLTLGLFLIMGISAIAFTIGFLFRFSLLCFSLCFLYVFLFDKALYNESYYLILLLSFLLLLTNADRWPKFSWSPKGPQTVPYWQIFLLRFQIAIVYLFGGISKLNKDWLFNAEPVHSILSTKSLPGFSLDQIWIAYLVSYAGLALDIAVGYLLLTHRHLKWALAGILIFNLFNLWLFQDIETFAFLMIFCSVIFLKVQPPKEGKIKLNFKQRAGFALILLYIIFQIVFPLRHLLYPGDVVWTYEGGRFAWRMKLNTKIVKMNVRITDPRTNKTVTYEHRQLLTHKQLWMDNIPDMMVQYAHYLREEVKKMGIPDPIINIEASASLNKRPFQPYIDPTVNFAEIKYPPLSHATWIIPFKENRTP